jgi:ferredoxin
MHTKIVVDYNRCESNARCMQVAPDIFEVRDDDKLYVLNEHPPESARERVLKAIRVCPKQALSISEND